MSSVVAGKRSWKCPECGREVLLSVTQLDPMACEECLARMKRGSGHGNVIADVTAAPLGVWGTLPEATKLGIVVLALVIGLLIGLVIGFFMGQGRAPQSIAVKHTAAADETESATDDAEVRPEAPGPGYKWVRGRKRSDDTRGPGHWAKDPFYKGDDGPSAKKKSK
jgi:hypothetical protein